MNRLLAATALETRVGLRYGIVPVAAALGVVWTLVLLAVPAEAAGTVAAYLLFLDTAGFGALFAAALLLFERTEGTRSALTVTPLRAGEGVAARLAVLTALTLLIAVPMLAAALRGRFGDLAQALPPVLGGVALTCLLLLTVCLAVGARARDLSGFLLAAPLTVAPLVLVPLVHVSGILEHPLLYAVPTTVGADLIRLGTAPDSLAASPAALAAGTVYALAWAAAGTVAASRAVERGAAPAPRRRANGRGANDQGAAGSARPVAGRGGLPAIARFARVDLFGTGRDPLLLLMLCAPVLLALVIRLVLPPASEFLLGSHGFDLAPHTPVVLAALVLLHVPMMFGVVGGLRAVEDSDENVLLVLRASPVSVPAYLGYRTALVTALSLAGLAAALPLSGLMTSGWSAPVVVALVLAALQAPLLTASMTALAANKVEALVVVKGLGALLVLTPVAAWVLPAPWNLLLLPLPPSWPALALPGYDAGPLGPWLCLAGGILVAAAALALLLRRTVRRIEGA
ncbi:fluoroquinolone export ABC transporter permease subunit [Nocardiopsis synnemataformans]|uniref:fluoroquinolone export ABC transporter permease subunit n=1 Tax=Nocardiopsis synnemataformans TaxID=61305 RepID=UPI003EB78B23